MIVEFKDLYSVLKEITDLIKDERDEEYKKNEELDALNEIFRNPSEEDVKKFIDDKDFRRSIIDDILRNDVKLISGFLELFSKAIDETWIRAKPDGAFYAYDENLKILLDVIEFIPLANIPPALMEAIAYNLDRISSYVGDSLGRSRSAYSTWCSRKKRIPEETRHELIIHAKARNSRLFKLWTE
jgi:predicted CopG family antitoxin